MPKPHTFPTLYDDLKTVRISFLAKHGYLKPNQIQTGKINWNKNGKVTGSIKTEVNTYAKNPYLELNYNCNEAQINYRALDKTLGVQFRSEHLHEQLYKKHFKKQYAGKPTKKYLKISQQLQRAASIPYHEVERILMR